MDKHTEVFTRVAEESRSDFKVGVKVDQSGQPYFYNESENGNVSTWAREYFDVSDARNLKAFIIEVKDDLDFHLMLVDEMKNEEAITRVIASRS